MRLNPSRTLQLALTPEFDDFAVEVGEADVRQQKTIVIKLAPLVGRFGRTQRIAVWQPRFDIFIYPQSEDTAFRIIDFLQQTPMSVSLDNIGTVGTIHYSELVNSPISAYDSIAREWHTRLSVQLTVDRELSTPIRD